MAFLKALYVFYFIFQANKEQLVLLMFQKFKISGFYASEQSHATSEAIGN